jgi:hypothetical protein
MPSARTATRRFLFGYGVTRLAPKAFASTGQEGAPSERRVRIRSHLPFSYRFVRRCGMRITIQTPGGAYPRLAPVAGTFRIPVMKQSAAFAAA